MVDSHEHGEHEAIIATSSISSIINFVDYLCDMVCHYCNTSLAGANLAIVQQEIEEWTLDSVMWIL